MLKKASTVMIRPLQRKDLEKIVIWNNDPEIESFVDLGLPGDLPGCVAWWEEKRRSKRDRLFALEDESGQLIGDLELANICWRSREAELRIRIGEKTCWNKGYGTSAVQQMVEYAFNELNMNRIYLRVYTFNIRAIKCYQKIGFKLQAVLKREKDQNWKDIYLMELEKKSPRLRILCSEIQVTRAHHSVQFEAR